MDVFFALNPIDRPALLIDLSPSTRIHVAAPARTAEETPGTVPGLYLVTRPTKAEETSDAFANSEMVGRVVVVTAAMMATVVTMPMATARWDCYHLGSCGGGHYGGAVTMTAAA